MRKDRFLAKLTVLAVLTMCLILGLALIGPIQGEDTDNGVFEIRDGEPPELVFPENGVTRGFYETTDGRWKFTGGDRSLPSATEYFNMMIFRRDYYTTKAL